MNALSHEFDLANATALPPMGRAPSSADISAMAARWDALHAAADAVADLAHLPRALPNDPQLAFPAALAGSDGWRVQMIERGVEDLFAVMQTGMRALLGVVEAGHDASAAAVTLWREFHSGREAIRDLALPGSPADAALAA